MYQYYKLEDFLYTKVYARACIETAKLYNSDIKIKQINFLFVLLCIKCEELKRQMNLLFILESLNPDDVEIQELANYIFKIRKKLDLTYPLNEKLESIFSSIFNNNYLYKLSNLELKQTFNTEKIVQEKGGFSLDYNQSKGKKALSDYISSDERKFKEICKKVIYSKNYKIENEILNQAYGDADFISSIEIDGKKSQVLFQFKKWINASITDKYLLSILNRIKNLKVEKCF